MARSQRLSAGFALACGLILNVNATEAPAAEATPVLGPVDPGPRHPPAGMSLFDELFPEGAAGGLPYPFERLLAVLNSRLAPDRARTALIPLGRSLQRYAAHPDYFASPRLVVAVDADGTSSIGAPLLRDRLFLGYQPAAEAIEVISYNEAAGRFEFQEVTDYGDDLTPEVSYAAREICVPCHQGHGPIFSRPLWSESNADPEVAEKLAALGNTYHGAPVRQGIDELDDFDLSTDRASRIAAINRLWDQGCGDGTEGKTCRAALLRAALHYRLVGARPEWRPVGSEDAAEFLHQRIQRLWPDGLATPSPDLPNRAPLAELAAVRSMDQLLETTGDMDPRTLRALLVQWRPAEDPQSTFAAVAREVAGAFATVDIVWLDQQLIADATREWHVAAPCRVKRLGDAAREELRLDCDGEEVSLAGFVRLDRTQVIGGRIDRLVAPESGEATRLTIAGGSMQREGTTMILRIVPREQASGLSARLPSGIRIEEIILRDSGSDATVQMNLVDDLAGLDRAIAALDRSNALDPGPLRRRAILGSIDQALAM